MKYLATSLLAVVGLAGVANAADVIVNADITVNTHWTANNVYDLRAQVYVRSGAVLTIDPGTVIASSAGFNGALVVTRNGTIMAMGTRKKPIIFTSAADRVTWVDDDPQTGTWRAAANEWGNVTIMGEGFMNDHNVVTNVNSCNAANRGNMEGLTRGGADDQYGGGSDADDSGVFKYVSLRYGGLAISPGVELNGLSLGAIGSGTDIHHVEIMNNLDDGIEVWGGAVNLKYLNIWNVGDDSLDIDQGYRGKIQFVLIVQGYSLAGANSGSGTGDNALEVDGAENCDWLPCTTTVVYNATVIGVPDSPAAAPARQGCDMGTAWRCNARVQYRNCIFMDLGENLIRHDATDGPPDNSCDYGAVSGGPGTSLTWAATWTTNFNTVAAPCGLTAQTNGKLAEMKDSVFFNNTNTAAYNNADGSDSVGVTVLGDDAPANNNVVAAASPIKRIVRAADVDYTSPNLTNFRMKRVIALDPRPDNDAVASVATAPNDGFFTQAQYRGAFQSKYVWVQGWTAADAYGFIQAPKADSATGTSDGGTKQAF